MSCLKYYLKDTAKTASIAKDGSAEVGLFNIAELLQAIEHLTD